MAFGVCLHAPAPEAMRLWESLGFHLEKRTFLVFLGKNPKTPIPKGSKVREMYYILRISGL